MPNPVGLDSGYSRRSLARLALAVVAKELSDCARRLVTTKGDFLEQALSLRNQATALIDRALVLERERGTSWEQIAAALAVSRQAAHERFSKVEAEWRATLDEPFVATGASGEVLVCQLPDGADDPIAYGRRLDAWVLRHDRTEAPVGDTPVTGALERATLLEQVGELLRQARRVVDKGDPAQLRAFRQRKVSVLAQIAASEPGNAEAARLAELARTGLAELEDLMDRQDRPRRP